MSAKERTRKDEDAFDELIQGVVGWLFILGLFILGLSLFVLGQTGVGS